jgi:hypothetical protein
MDTRFGTWNAGKLCRSDSLKTVVGQLVKSVLVLVGVQEVRCDKGGSEPTDDHTFFYGNVSANHH